VLNFIMHKSFTTNSMVLRRTRDLHLTGHRIERHKIFYTPNACEEMFFEEQVLG
jgi:hypothetical protein